MHFNSQSGNRFLIIKRLLLAPRSNIMRELLIWWRKTRKNSRLQTNILAKGIFFHKPVYLAVCLTVKCKSGIMGLLEEMNNLKGRELMNCKARLILISRNSCYSNVLSK